MPTISIPKKNLTRECESGANLMFEVMEAGQPVASSCHGEGVCAKCKLVILDGANNLGPQTEEELFLREFHGIPSNIRLSCQATVLGDVSVDATYW